MEGRKLSQEETNIFYQVRCRIENLLILLHSTECDEKLKERINEDLNIERRKADELRSIVIQENPDIESSKFWIDLDNNEIIPII